MNLRPYIPSAIAFGLALLCVAGAVQQFMAAQSPGAVVPLAIGGVPGSVVGLGLLWLVCTGAVVWFLPGRQMPPKQSDGWDIDPDAVCLEWIGRIAEHYAKSGNRRGLELVTELAVHCVGNEREPPVKGAKP